MTTWFVSRHPGAAQWARARGHITGETIEVPELQITDVAEGDVVIGNLPAHLAAEVCTRGASYHHLRLDRPLEGRGQELGPEALEGAGAAIEPYRVEAVPHLRRVRGPAVLVCIASGEALPNFLPMKVEEMRPAAIVLLASAAMGYRAAALEQVIKQSGLPKPELRGDLPDHDVDVIRRYGRSLADRLAKLYPDKRLLLNLTGGTKLIAIGLLEGMRHRCEVFYCDTMHERLEWLSPVGRGVQPLNAGLLSLDSYLLAQGLRRGDGRAEIRPSLSQATSTAESAARYLANAAASLTQDFFRRLNNAALARDIKLRTANGPILGLATDSRNGIETQVAQRLCKDGFLVERDGRFEVPPEEERWRFLAGVWLEVYCASVARALQADGLNAQRWATSLSVQPLQENSRNALQELDAVLVHRNRMLVIECKTGQQLAGDKPENQSVLNRLEVVADQVAGSLATRYLLATVDEFDPAVLRRAERYRIRLFTRAQLRDLQGAISEWMKA